MARKRASAQERQTQIIDAAIRCFQRKGFENTTVDDIAAEFGLSKGSIYWHYPSKKDILVAVYYHLISRLFQGYEAAILSDASARQKLIQVAKIFVDRLLKEHEVYRPLMVLWSAAYEDQALREISAELYRRGDELIRDILRQGEEKGEFVVPDRAAMSSLLVAIGEGLLTRQILVEDLNPDALGEAMVNLVERLLPAPKTESSGDRGPRVRKEVILNTSTRGPEGLWENASTGDLELEDVNVILTVGFAIEGQNGEKEKKA